MTLNEQLDYYAKLTCQFPRQPIRILYAASSTLPSATVVAESPAIVEHAIYWSATRTIDEAYYLSAILNSEAARVRVAALQARGHWGARHFDKVMLGLPIPLFSLDVGSHRELADVARQAEELALTVDVKGHSFQRARGIIRVILNESGLSSRIDALVSSLLS